jgi:hypothetical protein
MQYIFMYAPTHVSLMRLDCGRQIRRHGGQRSPPARRQFGTRRPGSDGRKSILSPGSHKRTAERQRKNHRLCIDHSNNNNHLETGQQALLRINEWHTAVTQPSTNPSDTHPPSRTSTRAKETQNTRLTSRPCSLALDSSYTAQVGYGASCPTDSGS